jgi:histone methylation protein DOT1
MSTTSSARPRVYEFQCAYDPDAFFWDLEANSSLFQPQQLRERLIALDKLDVRFGGLDAEDSTTCADSRLHIRAKALRTRIEAVNAELYKCVRNDIVRGGRPRLFFQWLKDLASQNESQITFPGLGFDCSDEFLSGVLQLREPGEPKLPQSPEIVPYQPTPVRHILHLLAATGLSKDDVFVDLGSGMGHVPLVVSMATGARSVGVEVQATYVASARECAQSLHLNRVRFIAQDAREADLSSCSVFYLYSPFKGSMLTDVLSALRMESTRRAIRICSLGPCTRRIANETWLKASTVCDTERIAVFDSR